MSLSTDAAISTLKSSAKRASDPRLDTRLSDVQSLLADDLAWVEQALTEASSIATGPADAAAAHLVALGGKRVRPTAVLLSAACAGPIGQEVRELAVIVELVHTATLLHDDVIDDGMDRRGATTARRIWGNAVSVLAGDTLLVHSLERTFRYAPQLMSGLLDTLQRLVSGEILQLRNRTELDLSLQAYDRILHEKTASLFHFATSGGALLAGADVAAQEAIGQFGERMGMAFQLVDDVLDYTGEASGKTLGADLLEGKVTLPLVIAVQEQPSLVRLVERIRSGEGAAVVEQLRQLVVDSGACDVVRRRALGETEAAVAALAGIADSPARRLLKAVATKLADRGR